MLVSATSAILRTDKNSISVAWLPCKTMDEMLDFHFHLVMAHILLFPVLKIALNKCGYLGIFNGGAWVWHIRVAHVGKDCLQLADVQSMSQDL